MDTSSTLHLPDLSIRTKSKWIENRLMYLYDNNGFENSTSSVSERTDISNPGGSSDISKKTKIRERVNRILPQALACIGIGFWYFVDGMSQSFPTVAIPQLVSVNETSSSFRLSDEEASWIGSISFTSILIGSLIGGYASDICGRKRTMVITMLPSIVATLINWQTYSFIWLVVSRILSGLTTGLKEASVVAYVGECAQTHLIGVFASWNIFIIFLGMLFETTLGATVHSWRQISFISAIVSGVILIIILPLPESPVWLLSHKKSEQAEKSLMWLRGTHSRNDVVQELEEIKASMVNSEIHGCSRQCHALGHRRTFIPFLIICFLFTFTEFTGNNVLNVYSVSILKNVGVPMNEYTATTITMIGSLIGVSISSVMFFRFGRRPIALTCYVGTTLALFGLGVYSTLYEHGYITQRWIPLTLILVYKGLVSAGPFLLPVVLMSEIVPLEGRDMTCAIAFSVYSLSSFISVKLYIYILFLVLPYQVFWIYGCLSMFASITIYFLLPETFNQSPDEICSAFLKNLKYRK